jgi:tRNA threonylcarbamoyladenosine biosynthesis protein TsaE
MKTELFRFNILSSSQEETISAGEKIAAMLERGDIVALRGGLGVGKTYLTKGIAKGLGIDEEITSPTYTIISEYSGRLPLYHIDAYRLSGDDGFTNIGGEEILYGNGVSVIEWSEKLEDSIPETAVYVEIEVIGENQRNISVHYKKAKGKK